MFPPKPNRYTRFTRDYDRYVEGQEKTLFEFLKNDDLQPRMTLPKGIALMIALSIHSMTILFFVLGVALLVLQFAGIFSICYATVFLGIAIFTRPRFNKPPKAPIKAEQFPVLYHFVNQIADHLHAPHVDYIVFNETYEASFSWVGLRQFRQLTLGYPFWMRLSSQEKIALIAHELAHTVNGDFGRHFVMRTAALSVLEWASFAPRKPEKHVFGEVLVDQLIVRHMLLLESRRATYLADSLTASISGTEALISLMKKREDGVYNTFPITTYPPNAYRIAKLETRPNQDANMSLSKTELEKIDNDVERLWNLIKKHSQ